MAWITWRQHRLALAGTGLLLGTCALGLGLSGLRMQSAHAALVRGGCQAASIVTTGRCGLLAGAFYHAGYPLIGNVPLLAIALAAIPVLLGMFVGAPLLAREYEAGTFRFAWTQAAGRTRWVVAKLGLLGAALTAAAAAFGALASWWLALADDLGSGDRWQPGQFGLTAVTFAGWTLLAFAIGALAGTLIRRTVPAMAVTTVSVPGLLLLAYERLDGLLVRAGPVIGRTVLLNVQPYGWGSGPVTFVDGTGAAEVTSSPAGGWPLRSWITGPHGRGPGASLVNQALGLAPPAENRWLAAHHLTLWTAYQPPGRFWLFQAAEGGACLLLALLLGVVTVWLARRRPA